MKASETLIKLIESFEGCSLKPYLCPAKVATIGFGSTIYENGTKVSMNDNPITIERAKALLLDTLKSYEKCVNENCQHLNQNQFDACVDFCYNLGNGSFKSSTLLKKIKADQNDPTIRNEFLKWNKAGGVVLSGLTRRRSAEADLYFKA